MKSHVVNVWLYPKRNRILLKGFKQWNDPSHVERSLLVILQGKYEREEKVKAEDKLEGGCDIPEERWWWPGLGQRSGKGQKCRFWRHLRYKVCERGKIDSIPTRAIRGRAKPVGGWGRQSNTWALGSDHLSSDASPDIYSVPQIPAINFFCN